MKTEACLIPLSPVANRKESCPPAKSTRLNPKSSAGSARVASGSTMWSALVFPPPYVHDLLTNGSSTRGYVHLPVCLSVSETADQTGSVQADQNRVAEVAG